MKFNYSSIIATLIVGTLVSAQVFAAKGGNKPPPEPVTAGDVVCDDLGGCVDTSDIVDGAVTEQKLSTKVNTLLGTITGLEARLDALEARVFIGDTGPAGGIVFYVDSTGLHGLEAAPIDQGIAEWGCVGVSLPGADGLVIGTGAQNTADIINNCADTNTAARLADAYVLNGYDDWFLPSKDELFMLNANNPVVGGFADDRYWSSSEYNSGDAWDLSVPNGNQSIDNKNRPYRVRAVRAF
jgi:hypothetical protein